ncbi:hypothetical protein C8A05DRAFT_44059 [Staphylotrichum tortipilum]|uniref:Uncharacterized protein n=1 Tax=Staphylotrichum tortipilum TaxID=2831512 RepID=A0AAN6MLA4_9PEZI|nr:hypothetical protein C8A05DRAFT_44059 [Staphylotrichum longicolle]
MSQQSRSAFDTPDMDDTVSEGLTAAQQVPPTRASAAASGRGRGRGRWARTKSTRVTKPAQQKTTAGRGRRHKVYDSLKAQAAHERTQELKQAYSAVVKLVKPAAQEIADRSVNELIEDPNLYKQVPEYDTCKTFLRERHQDTIRQADAALQHGLAMAEHVWKAQVEKVQQEFTTKLDELCYERYGQLLRKLEILEYLYDNGLPVDLAALEDDRYDFRSMTEEDANNQGVFHETEDGVEVPHSGLTITQLMVKPQTLPLDAARKAEGLPEGQPAPKVAATPKGADAVPQMPRHPAGLLGAAEAIEESAATTPDSGSNAPTPAAVTDAIDEPVAPARAEQRAASGVATPADGPELPFPRGASDPDEYGVRLISRRPNRLDVPNNRIMVPNLFEWNDVDIGFRDSTNCVQKGATKQRRGKYLGRPGSNYLFVDRRVGIWDSTLAAGELDEELVKKYKVHPTLGIPLPDSVNEWEPPKPMANGWKPIVFVPPDGIAIHTSRSIEPTHMEQEATLVERRTDLAQTLRTFCDQEGISAEEVAPDAELTEKHRADMLAARGIDPAQVIVQSEPPSQAQSPTPEPEPEPEPEAEPEPEPEAAAEQRTPFTQFAHHVLGAAATIEAEEDATRMAAAKRPAAPSRPYDAIRDVFTETPPPPAAQEAPPAPAPPAEDSANLSFLANAALQGEPANRAAHAEPMQYAERMMGHGEYEQPSPVEYPRQPVEYAPQPQSEPAYFARQDGQPAHMEATRNHDFLRTALNPQPPISHTHGIPPPAQEYAGVSVAPPAPAPGPGPTPASHAPGGRTPFSSTGAAKGLPALRPMRSLLNEPPVYPEPQVNPGMHHGSMVARPFHNAYSQPLPGSLQAPPLAPMGPSLGRRMSTPPPFHPSMGAQPLGPAPQPAHQPLAPATGPSTPSAASSKYRKLEPAPTPPHRMSYSGTGQELRTDYSAIRGWTHNNIRKTSRSASKGDAAHANTGANSDEPAA